MSAIITDDFRRNNADAFVTAINTLAIDSPLSQSTGYYVGIGKSDPWLDDTDAPIPTGSELERQDVLQNLNSMKLIESNEVERLLPKTGQAWVTGRKYKVYDGTDRTCFNQTIVGSSINQYACYAHLSGVLYLCLSNKSNGASSVSPSSAAAADGDVGENSGDSYVWTRIGVIPTASDFVDSTTFFEIPANLSSGIDTIGLLYGFKVVNGGAGYSIVDGAKAAKVRYTQLDGTTATAAVKINVVDGVVTSVGSATGSPLGSAIDLSEFTGFGVGASNGIRKASVMFDSEPTSTTRADIQPLFAPAGGFGADNLDVFPPFFVGIATDFVGADPIGAGNVTETLVDTKFRQCSIIKNIAMTADDSPHNFSVVNSLQCLNLSASISVTSDSGWYFLVNTSLEKAWIDFIDTTNNKVYFHQNSSADVTQDAIPSSGTVKVYNTGDVLQATIAYGSITAPEHNAFSGDVIMVDNRVPILRSSVQTEKVRIILQF